MAQKIIDLDALVGPPKKVQLGGEIYRLPADLPTSLYLKVSSYAESEMDEVEMAEDLYAELRDLFRVHQPDLESLPIGMVGLVAAIPAIYSAGAAAEDEGGARPSKAGTKSGKRRTSAKSRSSRS